jgi:hypothetical protein
MRKAGAAALAVLCLLAIAAAAQAERWPLVVGVATYSWNFDDPAMFVGMRDQGMTGVRLSLYRERANFDLATIQAELAVAAANGIEVAVNLTQEAVSPTPGFPEWAASMAARLPDVGRFVIGNEVNARRFWHGSIPEYVRLLHATRAAIRAARPDAHVSGFGLDSSHQPILYLARAAKAAARYGGLRALMDTLSLHLYTGSPARDAYLVRQAEKLWRGPINVDEAGYQVDRMGEQAQARSEVALLDRMSRDPQVRNVFFYRYRDSADADLATANVRADGTRRPGFYAVKAWACR